jgi:hypothetical protein
MPSVDTQPSLLATALGYAARGWAVFPCYAAVHGRCTCGNSACTDQGKHPRTENGCRDATTDPAQIRRYWMRWPHANIGIATGKASNLVVLDNDPRHGGDEGLALLQQQHGVFPLTIEAISGGGGGHLYFTAPADATIPNSVSKLAPGVDVRGEGGYIIAPPSVHRSGNTYEWELLHHPDEVPLAPLPEWVITLAHAATNGNGAPFTLPDTIPEGGRNDTLFRLGCSLRAKGLSEPAIRAALLAENQERCHPPLSEHEVDVIAASAGTYPPGQADGHETITVEPFTVTPKASPDIELFDGIREVDDRFRRTWEHRRKDLKTQAFEVYEYSLARQTRAAEWPIQEIVNLLIYHRRKYTASPQEEAYYRKVLQKTAIDTDKTDEDGLAEANIEEALTQGTGAAMTFLQEKLGIPITAVMKRGEENARYSFQLEGGREIEIGSANILLNHPRQVRAKLFEVSGLAMKNLKDEEWRRIVNVLRVVLVYIPIEDSSRVTQIREWVRGYLDSAGLDEFPRALVDNAPVVEDGVVYVHQATLRRYIITHWMERVESQDVRSWLSEAGFTVVTKSGRIAGKPMSRSYWKAPESTLMDLHPLP